MAQVSQRWRYLALGSASHLRLCLLCTTGTPVADMLTHSPPFPLIIYYDERFERLSAEDEEGIMLALGHRNRVRCICAWLPVPRLSKFLVAMDDEFPALIFLHLGVPEQARCEHLTSPSVRSTTSTLPLFELLRLSAWPFFSFNFV